MQQQEFDAFLGVIISVLARQDIAAIGKLKEFLTSLPNPRQVEELLGQAVLHFAEADANVFNWLVVNQAALLPELELVVFTQRFVTLRLSDRGYLQGQDFNTQTPGQLVLNSSSTVCLANCFSAAEQLLINTILQVSEASFT